MKDQGMGNLIREIERLRMEVEALRRIQFHEKPILSLLRRLLRAFQVQLPNAHLKQRRNKWICNFGMPDVALVMIEPVHGSRSSIPLRWRLHMLDTIDEILDRVESMLE
jgi:hypothetical protein